MAKRPSAAAAFSTLGKDTAEIGSTLAQGGWKTKLSFQVFGIFVGAFGRESFQSIESG